MALFRGVNLRLRFDLHDGLKVIVSGRLDVYAPRGQYNLVVEQILPRGIGELELAYRQTRERLFALGFFDAARRNRFRWCRAGWLSSQVPRARRFATCWRHWAGVARRRGLGAGRAGARGGGPG